MCERVCHSEGEYMRDAVRTNGIESFRSMLKRACRGIFHDLGPKHLDRYVREFAAMRDWHGLDTIDIMGTVSVKGSRYVDLIADNGLPGGAHGRWNHRKGRRLGYGQNVA